MNLDIYAKSLQFEDGRQLLIQKLDFVKKMYVVVDKINLCFICVEDRESHVSCDYFFLYDDSLQYENLLKLIINQPEVVKDFMQNYDKRTFWGDRNLREQLLRAAIRKFGLSRCREWYGLFKSGYHDRDDNYEPLKIDNVDAMYEFLESMLPDNIDETRRKKALADEKAQQAKRQQLANALLRRYGPVSILKENLRSSINRLGFMELLELFKEYKAQENYFSELVAQSNLDRKDSLFNQYADIYRLGSVLISDRMNQINRNKTKNKYIPQDLLDEAMVFYYDADSPQDAYAARSAEIYSQAKESGDKGEKKVDYALKWLDTSYVKIEKRSKDKAGNLCILISNPTFIDEKQEYDHLIVSSKGVFSIETKNFAGKLVVDKSGNWIRKKDGGEEGMKNPLQQVRQHEKLLASFLPRECHIISILCIANDKAVIEGEEHCPIPIVKSDLLVEFIENWKETGSELSDDQKEDCVATIYEHMV